MAGAIGGGGVGIGIAAAGFGAWAIVAQQVMTALISTVLLWVVSPWRPSCSYSFASLRKLGSFSANVFGQRLLYQGARSADNLLIGRFLGPAAAGAYALSYNVMLAPLSRLGGPVSEVLFPALSRIQDDRERVGSIWLRVNRVTAAISVPALLGLVVVADDFVRVLLGSRWHAAVPVVRVLAWVGVLQAVQNLNEDIFQALDRTGTMVAYMALWAGGGIAAVVVGLHWGIVGVAVCFAIANTLLSPLYVWLTARVAGIPTWRFVSQLRGVAEASAAMALAVYGAKLYLVSAGVPSAARLVILTALGVVVYLPLVAWRARDVVADVRRLRPREAT
jgi:O-antigen/teichoic acid export membrane protein